METRRTFSCRRIKSLCVFVSSLHFGKASVEFIVIHFLHDTEYVLHDYRVLEHLQVARQRIECLLIATCGALAAGHARDHDRWHPERETLELAAAGLNIPAGNLAYAVG